MRSAQNRRHELDRELSERAECGLDPTQAKRIGTRNDRLPQPSEPEAKARVARRLRHSPVRLAMRVGDRYEPAAGGGLECRAAVRHCPDQLVVAQMRQRVVAQRVKADVVAGLDQPLHLGGSQSDVLRLGPDLSSEPLGDGVALGRAHDLDPPGDLVDPISLDRDAPTDIHGALKPLPPERKREFERRTAEKERRRSADGSKSRRHDARM